MVLIWEVRKWLHFWRTCTVVVLAIMSKWKPDLGDNEISQPLRWGEIEQPAQWPAHTFWQKWLCNTAGLPWGGILKMFNNCVEEFVNLNELLWSAAEVANSCLRISIGGRIIQMRLQQTSFGHTDGTGPCLHGIYTRRKTKTSGSWAFHKSHWTIVTHLIVDVSFHHSSCFSLSSFLLLSCYVVSARSLNLFHVPHPYSLVPFIEMIVFLLPRCVSSLLSHVWLLAS